MTNTVSIRNAANQQFDRDKANPVLLALMVVGLFIKLALSDVMLSTDGSTGPASSLIWGYGIVVFSMLGLIIVNVSPGSNEWNDVKSLPWVLLLTMVLLLWLIGMSIQYFKEINLRNVPDEYFMWSNYSTILLIALLGISIYQFMLTALGVEQKANELAIYAGIVFVFNLVAITIQQIILNCFYVDG
jgi:hypothetical protein